MRRRFGPGRLSFLPSSLRPQPFPSASKPASTLRAGPEQEIGYIIPATPLNTKGDSAREREPRQGEVLSRSISMAAGVSIVRQERNNEVTFLRRALPSTPPLYAAPSREGSEAGRAAGSVGKSGVGPGLFAPSFFTLRPISSERSGGERKRLLAGSGWRARGEVRTEEHITYGG